LQSAVAEGSNVHRNGNQESACYEGEVVREGAVYAVVASCAVQQREKGVCVCVLRAHESGGAVYR